MQKEKQFNIDQLLLYALSKLIDEKKPSTFENLVVFCYKLFPQAFGLKGYVKKFPDSSRVDKTWRRCRTDRGWVSGSVGHGFAITSEGGKELTSMADKGKKSRYIETKIQAGDKRTKSGRVISHIEKHQSFLNYKKNKRVPDISDYLVCDLLYSTLDSFPASRKKSLYEMKKLVAVYKRKDISNFLEWVENNKKHLFT